jgi:beta-aspartyl-dipeptidase (metallo-type)
LPASAFVQAGIGTAVGCLGYDTTVRRPEVLLERIRHLRQHGVAAHMFTGEIGYPPATLTGSIRGDLALIPETVGVKAAIAEHGSAMETWQEVAAMAGEAYRGSRIAGKPTILHLHVGLSRQRLTAVVKAIERHSVDPAVITLTHVNWSASLLHEACSLAAEGINLDVTACIRPSYFLDAVEPAAAVYELLSAGVGPSQLTVSSDAGGCHPGENGELIPHDLYLLGAVLRDAAGYENAPLDKLLSLFTRTPADRLGLSRKGRIEPGADADLLLLGPDLSERGLFLRGREVMSNGVPTMPDPFKESHK